MQQTDSTLGWEALPFSLVGETKRFVLKGAKRVRHVTLQLFRPPSQRLMCMKRSLLAIPTQAIRRATDVFAGWTSIHAWVDEWPVGGIECGFGDLTVLHKAPKV